MFLLLNPLTYFDIVSEEGTEMFLQCLGSNAGAMSYGESL